MKKLLLFCTTYILLASTAHAATSLDCGFVQNGVQRSLAEFDKSLNLQWPALIPKKAFGQALQNLSNYCFGKAGGAESDYLFDHLIDIGFRSLDAYQNASLRYNVDPDPEGLERQKLVSEYANPTKNIIPETIIQGFNSYWPSAEPPGSTLTIDVNCSIANSNNLSLYGRYKAVCETAKCIINKRTFLTQNIAEKSSIAKLNANPSICDSLAEIRYTNEISYMRQLVARAGIRNITNLVEQYTKNYFVNTRRQNLYERFTRFDQDLSFVNRKVQEGTPVCSAK